MRKTLLRPEACFHSKVKVVEKFVTPGDVVEEFGGDV